MVRYGASTGFVCTGLEGILANNMFRIEPSSPKIEKSFLIEYLKSKHIQKQISVDAYGAAMPALSFSVIREYLVPLPSLAIQKEWIAKITQEISIIEGNKRLIEIYNQKVQNRIRGVWGK